MSSSSASDDAEQKFVSQGKADIRFLYTALKSFSSKEIKIQQLDDEIECKLDGRQESSQELEVFLEGLDSAFKRPKNPPESCSKNSRISFTNKHRVLMDQIPGTVKDLVTKERELQVGLFQKLLKEKKELEVSLGVNRKISGMDLSLARDTSEYAQLVLEVAQAMQHLMSILKTHSVSSDEVGLTEEIAELRLENSRLKAEERASKEQVRLLETAFESIKSGKNPVPTGTANVLRLEETKQRMTKLYGEFESVSAQNGKLVVLNGQLKDDLSKAIENLATLKLDHQMESHWFRPRIDALEKTVISTGRTFEGLALDLELLTQMYISVYEELEHSNSQLTSMSEEQASLCSKFKTLIKKMQVIRTENSKKEKVVTALMAVRQSMIGTAQEAQTRVVKLVERLRKLNSHLNITSSRVLELETERESLKSTLRESQARELDLLAQLNDAEGASEKQTAAHGIIVKAMQKEIDNAKTSSMDATMREAYDEMQMRLKHSLAAYRKLEEKFNSVKEAKKIAI